MMSFRVVCVKQGKKYTDLQVERLYTGVRAWVPNVEEFICITDDPDTQMIADIKTHTLPDHPGLKGWWAKLYQFALQPKRTLYFDIDVQIRDTFAPYMTNGLYAPKDPLADYQPEKAVTYINSSVMLYDLDFSDIYEHYMSNWQTWQSRYRGDQEYLWGEHQQRIDYIGDYTESFKWGWGLKHGFARKPVVLYHGEDVKKYV